MIHFKPIKFSLSSINHAILSLFHFILMIVEDHKILMRDRCIKCGNPISFFPATIYGSFSLAFWFYVFLWQFLTFFFLWFSYYYAAWVPFWFLCFLSLDVFFYPFSFSSLAFSYFSFVKILEFSSSLHMINNISKIWRGKGVRVSTWSPKVCA